MCVVGVRVRRPGKQVVCPIRYVRHTGASEHLVGGRSISLTSSEGWTKICECCPFQNLLVMTELGLCEPTSDFRQLRDYTHILKDISLFVRHNIMIRNTHPLQIHTFNKNFSLQLQILFKWRFLSSFTFAVSFRSVPVPKVNILFQTILITPLPVPYPLCT